MKNKDIRIKLNVALGGYPKGWVLRLPAINGVPVDQFWRRRVKDSAIDDCVTIINKKKELPKEEKTNLPKEKKKSIKQSRVDHGDK